MDNKRLVRSQDDRMFAGVAGGIAEYLNVDAILVRLFFVLTCLFCGGLGLVIYLIMWLLMPEEDVAEKIKMA